jgi:hypothetical protein
MRDGLYITETPKPKLSGAYVMFTIGGASRKTVDMKSWKHDHGMTPKDD